MGSIENDSARRPAKRLHRACSALVTIVVTLGVIDVVGLVVIVTLASLGSLSGSLTVRLIGYTIGGLLGLLPSLIVAFAGQAYASDVQARLSRTHESAPA